MTKLWEESEILEKLWYFKHFYLFLFYVYSHFVHMDVSVLVPVETRRTHWMLWNWSYG